MKIQASIMGVLLICGLASCATRPSVTTPVGDLATQLGPGWSEHTAEEIFVRGTNVLSIIWTLEETDGYPDVVYDRARYVARWLEYRGALYLCHEDRLLTGTLPVSHENLQDAITLTVPLLVPKGLEDNWKQEQVLMTQDGTRALVRCSAVYGPLSGKGWILIFNRTGGVWTLVLIEREWIS